MPRSKQQVIIREHGKVIYCPQYLSNHNLNELFKALKEEVYWEKKSIQFYGQEHPLDRLTAWHSDPSLTYTYSGIYYDHHPWTSNLLMIKEKLAQDFKLFFNAVLLNFYPNGKSKMGWHSDDENEIVPDSPIASISLGSERYFHFRRKNNNTKQVKCLLKNGDLLLMQGELQKFWQHRLAPNCKQTSPRINLTFRRLNETTHRKC